MPIVPPPPSSVDAVVAVVFGRVVGLRMQTGRTASSTIIRESQMNDHRRRHLRRPSNATAMGIRSMMMMVMMMVMMMMMMMIMIGFTSHRDAGKMCLFLSYQWRSTTCRNRRQKP